MKDGRIMLMADYLAVLWYDASDPADAVRGPVWFEWLDSYGYGAGADVLPATLKNAILDWQGRFELGLSGSDEAARTFNWDEFHANGLALCKELREIFPPTVELYYSRPHEDTRAKSELIKI